MNRERGRLVIGCPRSWGGKSRCLSIVQSQKSLRAGWERGAFPLGGLFVTCFCHLFIGLGNPFYLWLSVCEEAGFWPLTWFQNVICGVPTGSEKVQEDQGQGPMFRGLRGLKLLLIQTKPQLEQLAFSCVLYIWLLAYRSDSYLQMLKTV